MKIPKQLFSTHAAALGFILIMFVALGGFALSSVLAQTNDINELTGGINSKRTEIDELERKIQAFRQEIQTKRNEAGNIRTSMSLLENEIAVLELDIEATQKRIEQTNLEIQKLNLEIKQTEREISGQKIKMAGFIRQINLTDNISPFEILLNNTTFSEFFDQLQYTQQIYSSLGETLDLLKDQRRNLEIQGQNWQQKIAQEEDLKDELLNKKSEIDERSNAQQILLVQTQLNERAYQQNLHQLQLEQQQVNSEIITLERRVRETLENQEKNEFLQSQGPAELAWPVSPARGITAFFHDPSYPFRYIFEHPAIDIRAAQGTPIKAPAAGYVARVKFAGDKSYAFIMLIHNNGFSTVYGHVSQPLVQEEQLVTKGQIIGMTGGLAGSVGAGNLSTGPHLHLEVRLDGIPVDPLHYLPPY